MGWVGTRRGRKEGCRALRGPPAQRGPGRCGAIAAGAGTGRGPAPILWWDPGLAFKLAINLVSHSMCNV